MAASEPKDLQSAVNKARLLESLDASDNMESLTLNNGAGAMSEENMMRALRKLLQEEGLTQNKVHNTKELEEPKNQNANLEGVLESIRRERAEMRQARQWTGGI